MSNQNKHHRLRRNLAAIGAVALAVTAMSGIGATAANAAGAATNGSWSISNNATNATGVTYTVQLTTATTATIASVTATLPSGTADTALTFGQVFGLGTGSVTFSGSTVTYTVTTPASVASGIPIYIEFTGLTNAPTAGAYSSTLSTFVAAAGTATDTVTNASAFTLGGTTTIVNVEVPKSLTFTSDTSAFVLATDPSLSALQTVSKAVTLTVKTNAGQGYTLSARDAGLNNGGTGVGKYTIAAADTTNGVATMPVNQFGFSAALATPLNSVAVLAQTPLRTTGTSIGYSTTATSIVTATKPTGNTADSLVLTNTVKVDYSTPAGNYTDTITYTVAPTY